MIRKFRVSVNGQEYDVQVEEIYGDKAEKSRSEGDGTEKDRASKAVRPVQVRSEAGREVKSPMPGTIVRVIKGPGDSVKRGEVVMILEAMKMENDIMSPGDGIIGSMEVNEGSIVSVGAVLFTVI
jgi:glutaconyl-CoA/methylmalonyl-CoA decarboxylase subunit gamma